MEIKSDKTRRRAKTYNPWRSCRSRVTRQEEDQRPTTRGGHGDQELQDKQKRKDPQPVEVMEIKSDKTRRKSKTHNPWRSWRSRVTRQAEEQRPTTRGGHGDQE